MTRRARNRSRKSNISTSSQQRKTNELLTELVSTVVSNGPPQPQVKDKIPMQLKDKQVATFKRSVTGSVLSVSTSGITAGGLALYLASFDPTGEISDGFNFYRIVEVTVEFVPVADFVSTSSVDYGNIHTAIDYGDDAVPASKAELQDNKTYKVNRTGQQFQRVWTPHFTTLAVGAGGNRWAIAPSRQWLWCSGTGTDDVLHYGLKWVIDQVTGVTNGAAIYRQEISVIIQAKHPL